MEISVLSSLVCSKPKIALKSKDFKMHTQCKITEYLLEWLKLKILTTLSFHEDVEELKLSDTAHGSAQLYKHLDKTL